MAGEFEFYHYTPTMVGAIIFTVVFLGATCLHSYQMLATRTWLMIPFVLGGFFELTGYVGRALSSQQSPNWTLGPYIMQSLLLLVAPALFAASIYMELGRIILLVDGESHALIKKKWLTKIFVCGDIISFFAQGAGGGIQASGGANSLDTGSHIITAGLFIQLAFFACFIVVAIHFDLSMHKVPTSRAQDVHIPWRKHLITLYIGSVLIMIRSLIRVIEYLQGFSGYILSYEIFLYMFDALPMFAVMVLFNVIHPSEVVALMRGGKAARMGWKMQKIEGHQRIESGSSLSNFVEESGRE